MAIAIVGCSSEASEGTSASEADTSSSTLTVASAWARATGAGIEIHITKSASAGVARVRVTGPGVDVSVDDGGAAGGAEEILTATGALQACTSYAFEVFAGTTSLGSGNVWTPAPGGGACPLAETLFPSGYVHFRGVNHARVDKSWCTADSWAQPYRVYPQGSAWLFRSSTSSTGPVPIDVGYDHYWNAGTDPMPCAERFVDVYRGKLDFDLGDWRMRNVASAVLSSTFTSYGKSGPRPDLCVGELSVASVVSYPATVEILNQRSDYGATWTDVLGTLNWRGLEHARSTGIALTASGASAAADVTSRLVPANAPDGASGLQAGFTLASDGFPSMTATMQSFAQDNDECLTKFDGFSLAMTYAQVAPPTTPSCTIAAGCDAVVRATCAAMPYEMRIEQSISGAWVVRGSIASGVEVDASSTASTTAQYRVCSHIAGSLVESCSLPVTLTTPATCGGGGGGGTPGQGACRRLSNGTLYCPRGTQQ